MRLKILLVDDREDNLLSMESLLAPSGYELVKALSGNQALKILLKELDFAMILMDVKMPGLSGFETASLIYEREKLRHIPIIFITANNYDDENIFKGYQTGAIDYIFKPINPDLLRAKVGVLVDLYKKNRLLIEQEKKLMATNRSLEREISDRIASEEKVKELNHKLLKNIADLESANKDLEHFAFMASHDLQEPLRKIRVFADRLLLKYSNVFADESNTLLRIQQGAERMQLLINDILAFSKMSKEQVDFAHCDTNRIVSDVVEELQDDILKSDATFIIQELPVISANPALLRILFQNVISNALKYRRDNVAPVIRITSDKSTTVGDSSEALLSEFHRIYVEDNGIGFDQKHAEDIFGMFKRLHSKDKFKGTGIGLALCRKIAEKHHGFISAQSKVDAGTRIIISLPQKVF